MNKKKIGQVLLSILVLCISTGYSFALEPSFSFYPSSGVVEDINEGFTVDVLIDSAGQSVSKARVTIKYDPNVIQLRKALRNNSLFEQWPIDESSTDNTNGVVMLTGYTPSDSSKDEYITSVVPDVFTRLEFDIKDLSAKSITLDFEYSFTVSEEPVPSTAIEPSTVGMIVGLILILIGAFVRGSNPTLWRKKKGTIVLYE
ncbi:MAG: hypothetical protein UR36_C0018G0034 [candidate division WS6 bacterium GW2011_GWF1_33_233]|nr:MAG: hypothetical protein UR36_C0018G0034 [candidate division WS6 bacterium GW2011_GWF1_33_233]